MEIIEAQHLAELASVLGLVPKLWRVKHFENPCGVDYGEGPDLVNRIKEVLQRATSENRQLIGFIFNDDYVIVCYGEAS